MATQLEATADDVKAALPHLELGLEADDEGAERQPSETDVERFLEEGEGRVLSAIGGIPAESDRDTRAAAKGLVVLYAASRTERAAYPERGSSYSDYLYDLFQDGLVELKDALGVGEEGEGAGPARAATAAYSFPERPLFRRDSLY